MASLTFAIFSSFLTSQAWPESAPHVADQSVQCLTLQASSVQPQAARLLLRGATSGQLGQVADVQMSAPGILAQAPTNGFTCWPFPRLVVQSASFPHNIILAARSLAVSFSTPFHAVQSIYICGGCRTG